MRWSALLEEELNAAIKRIELLEMRIYYLENQIYNKIYRDKEEKDDTIIQQKNGF